MDISHHYQKTDYKLLIECYYNVLTTLKFAFPLFTSQVCKEVFVCMQSKSSCIGVRAV